MGFSFPWNAVGIDLVWAYEGVPRPCRLRYCDDALYLTSWLVLEGEAFVDHEGKKTVARKGEWLFPRPVPRYQGFSSDTRLLSLALRIVWPDGRSLFDEGLSLVLPSAEYPDLARQAHRLCRALAESGDLIGYFGFQEALYGWTRQLCETLTSAGVPMSPLAQGNARLTELLNLLETCPLDEMHPGRTLARRLGVSQVHLERLCTAAVGRTAKQYLEARRLEYARRALLHKLAKVVAAEIGFSHVSTFSAWYKRKTGHSPTLGP